MLPISLRFHLLFREGYEPLAQLLLLTMVWLNLMFYPQTLKPVLIQIAHINKHQDNDSIFHHCGYVCIYTFNRYNYDDDHNHHIYDDDRNDYNYHSAQRQLTR